MRGDPKTAEAAEHLFELAGISNSMSCSWYWQPWALSSESLAILNSSNLWEAKANVRGDAQTSVATIRVPKNKQ